MRLDNGSVVSCNTNQVKLPFWSSMNHALCMGLPAGRLPNIESWQLLSHFCHGFSPKWWKESPINSLLSWKRKRTSFQLSPTLTEPISSCSLDSSQARVGGVEYDMLFTLNRVFAFIYAGWYKDADIRQTDTGHQKSSFSHEAGSLAWRQQSTLPTSNLKIL